MKYEKTLVYFNILYPKTLHNTVLSIWLSVIFFDVDYLSFDSQHCSLKIEFGFDDMNTNECVPNRLEQHTLSIDYSSYTRTCVFLASVNKFKK